MLTALVCNFEIVNANTVSVETIGILIAGKGSYEHKEELKKHGFYWNPQEKRWQKKINMSDYHKELQMLKSLTGKVDIQLAKK